MEIKCTESIRTKNCRPSKQQHLQRQQAIDIEPSTTEVESTDVQKRESVYTPWFARFRLNYLLLRVTKCSTIEPTNKSSNGNNKGNSSHNKSATFRNDERTKISAISLPVDDQWQQHDQQHQQFVPFNALSGSGQQISSATPSMTSSELFLQIGHDPLIEPDEHSLFVHANPCNLSNCDQCSTPSSSRPPPPNSTTFVQCNQSEWSHLHDFCLNCINGSLSNGLFNSRHNTIVRYYNGTATTAINDSTTTTATIIILTNNKNNNNMQFNSINSH
ncbi:hypothetical protein BLOT_015190 [Blomia tropicalis]|nr:hypothetical protein BLOT_015190 [Blomia tropicalis]